MKTNKVSLKEALIILILLAMSFIGLFVIVVIGFGIYYLTREYSALYALLIIPLAFIIIFLLIKYGFMIDESLEE